MTNAVILGRENKTTTVMDEDFVYHNGLILGAFILYTLCAVFFFLYNDLYQYASFKIYKSTYFVIFFILLFFKILFHALSNRVRYGYYLNRETIIPNLRKNWLNARVIFTVSMPLLGIPFMMSLFGSVKTLFPAVNPFYLDMTFMEFDRILHFGFHPWELTHAVFGSVYMTEIIDYLYQIWFFIVLVFTVWMVASPGLGKVRVKFLLSYILTWSLLGSFLAVILPAAGPCFYSNFVDGVDVYAPLMDRLNEISAIIKADTDEVGLFATLNQGLLWAFYTDDYIGLGSGITAMPSMHVSFAMLLFLSVYEMNRKMGYVALLYLIFVQIGSVHLGWHYAIDGYLSIILTWGIWRFSGWLANRVSKPTE